MKTSAALTQALHNEDIGCFKGTFSFQVKGGVKLH